MKNLNISILFILCLGLATRSAIAESMDPETQDGVILRLERVFEKMRPQDPSRLATILRLGDLHAERARRLYLSEVEANCEGCKGSFTDRERALGLYQQVVEKTKNEQRGLVLTQMAQLNQLKNNSTKAIQYLSRITENKEIGQKPFSRELIAKAHEKLGDAFYRQGEFLKAYNHFQKALQDPQIADRAHIIYRGAWCQFNLGHLKTATQELEKLLNHKNILVRRGTEGDQYDPVLHGDIVADLAIYYAKQNVGPIEVQKYISYLPAEREKELMLHFVNENDRLAARPAALLMLEKYIQMPLSEVEKLNAEMKVARIYYGMGKNTEATEKFDRVSQSWQKKGCNDANLCAELRIQMRNFVSEFHRSKKLEINQDVLKLYQSYTNIFIDDYRMNLTGAQIARELKNYNAALLMFHQAAIAAHQVSTGVGAEIEASSDRKSDGKALETLDNALNGEIEIAEKSNNFDLREKAYLFFLQLKPKDIKAYSVRYQLAHVYYERKEYQRAAEAFHQLAMESVYIPSDITIRKQAADLSLDALVLLKQDEVIENWATQYAGTIKESRLEYAKIARKASINIVAKIANDRNSKAEELRTALQKSRSTVLLGIRHDEHLKILKTQFLLAKKIPDLTTAQIILNDILDLPKISRQEKEDALNKKVWLHEMRFEFKQAYSTLISIKPSKDLKEDDRELRLATLAELAEIDPKIHYERFLKFQPRGEKAVIIRGHLIEISKNPLEMFRKYQGFLIENPTIYGDLALLMYGKVSTSSQLGFELRTSILNKSNSGRVLIKLLTMEEIRNFSKRISASKFFRNSDRSIQRSIKERISLLKQADHLVQRSMSEGSLQIMALSIIGRENMRLYNDLLTSPLPRGLRKFQKEQYKNLLQGQAEPFRLKGGIARDKVAEIWNHSKVFENLSKEMDLANQKLKPILIRQAQILSEVLDSHYRDSLHDLMIAGGKGISKSEIISVRENVRKDPFDRNEIEKLKNLETKRGNDIMVAYLDTRIKSIQGW